MILVFVCLLLPARAHAQLSPPVWNNISNYAAGDMVTDYGNVYRCIAPVTTHYLDPSKTYTNWELFYVRSNTTLQVGVECNFPTFQIAWNFAQNAHIAQGAYLHLNITTFWGPLNESFPTGINLDAPCGASMSLIGDNSAQVVFTSPNGIQLDTGHSFGSVSGISLEGSSQFSGTGVALTGNSSIGSMSKTNIYNVNNSISVDRGAQLNCAASVNIIGFSIGVSATRGGQVEFAPGASFGGNGYDGGATALYEAFGGHIEAPDATISWCSIGLEATQGGSIMVEGAHFVQNNYGMVVTMKGHVDAEYAAFSTGNDASHTVDIECYTGSTVDGSYATVKTTWLGNADGSYVYD